LAFLWPSLFDSLVMVPTINLLLDLVINPLLDFCAHIFFVAPTYTCTIINLEPCALNDEFLTYTCTVINLEPCALNDEFHFISKFNKISKLCKYR